MRPSRGALMPALLAALLAAPQRPAAEPGQTAVSTLRIPLSARGSSMGEAFSAVPGGVDSLGYNPAGLSAAPRPVLETTFTNGIAEDRFSYSSYAHPLPFGVLAAGFIYYDAGSIHLNLSDGTDRVVKAEQDFVGLAAAAFPLGGGLSVGGAAKFFRVELAGAARATGYAADAGALWETPVTGLSLGASLQNLGPDVTFEQTGDPLPLTTRIGASYLLDLERFGLDNQLPYRFMKFRLTVDGFHVREEEPAGGVGLEMDLPFAKAGHALLRLGYIANRDIDSLTLGVGFRETRFRLDYALGVKEELRNAHHFTVGVQF